METYGDDGVESVGFAVLDVVAEHEDDFVQVELPGSAKSEQEHVVEPGVLGDVVHDDPLLEALKHLLLLLRHFSEIAECNGQNWSVTYPLGSFLATFFLPHMCELIIY